LWDVRTQRELASLGGNDDQVSAIAFTPDEKSVFTLALDGKIKVWDLDATLRRDVLWSNKGSIVSFSADERVVATGNKLGEMHLWDLVSGSEIRTFQTGEDVDISFSPTDDVLAWAGLQSVGILDYQSGRTNIFPISRTDGFWAPGFSTDGRELAFANATNIMILEMATRKARPFAVIETPVLGLAFSPDGSLLASAHTDGTLTVWDHTTGRKVWEEKLAHPPLAMSVEFSRDGRLLASGGADATGKIWDVIPGGLKLRRTLRGHLGWVGLFLSPDGRRAVSNSEKNTLKLWDTETGLEVGTLYGHRGGITGVAFSRDGNTMYSAAKDGELRVWRAPPLDQLKASKNH
jgi:WD40 repeat protein